MRAYQVDRVWASRVAVPPQLRQQLRDVEEAAQTLRDTIRGRLRASPANGPLAAVLKLLDSFLDNEESGALAAALRRDAIELLPNARGRRILDHAWGTIERAARRSLESDDLRVALVSDVSRVRARFDATVPWHLSSALAEWGLSALDRSDSVSSIRRQRVALELVTARMAHFARDVSRVSVRVLERTGWPEGVAPAELAHAVARRVGRVAEHPSVRRRERLRAAAASQTAALLGPAGTAGLDRASERMADELIRIVGPRSASPLADIDASAILLRGALRLRSTGRVSDPVVDPVALPTVTSIGVATLFGPFVVLQQGLASPIQAMGGALSCGATIDCVAAPITGGAVSRPIDEWGSPLFDHPPAQTLQSVVTTRAASVRVFARLDGGMWLGQLIARGELADGTSAGEGVVRAPVQLLRERRELRPNTILVAQSIGTPATILCGIKREEVSVPVVDLPRVIRVSATSGEAYELLESEQRFLVEARRRSRVILPCPVGVDALSESFLYAVPEGLSLEFSSSVRQLRKKGASQLAAAVAALWRSLHEDVLLERRPNSLALGLYHEKTIMFRPMIGRRRDGLRSVIVAAPCATFTDMPYPRVSSDARGLPFFARLGGPSPTQWLQHWGTATPGHDAYAALLFMLELLAVRPLGIPVDATWGAYVDAISSQVSDEESFQDPDTAKEFASALRLPGEAAAAFLNRYGLED